MRSHVPRSQHSDPSNGVAWILNEKPAVLDSKRLEVRMPGAAYLGIHSMHVLRKDGCMFLLFRTPLPSSRHPQEKRSWDFATCYG